MRGYGTLIAEASALQMPSLEQQRMRRFNHLDAMRVLQLAGMQQSIK
jgi:hypothetical protein